MKNCLVSLQISCNEKVFTKKVFAFRVILGGTNSEELLPKFWVKVTLCPIIAIPGSLNYSLSKIVFWPIRSSLYSICDLQIFFLRVRTQHTPSLILLMMQKVFQRSYR